jgi:hypothetical protein
MKYVFGFIAAFLSLSCIGLVALYAVALAVRLREEKRVWTDYPAMLVEHWGETAIFFGLLLLSFAFLAASINFLGRRAPEA